MELITPKKCGCGREHKCLPANAKPWVWDDSVPVDSYIFNCECNSTLMVKISNIKMLKGA